MSLELRVLSQGWEAAEVPAAAAATAAAPPATAEGQQVMLLLSGVASMCHARASTKLFNGCFAVL